MESLHRVAVADPYRWLEAGASAEVQAWTDAQNTLTRGVLDAVPGREAIRARVASLLAVGWLRAPEVRNRRYFCVRRTHGSSAERPLRGG